MLYERQIRADDNATFNIIHQDDFEYADPEAKFLEYFLFVGVSFLRKRIPPAIAQEMMSAGGEKFMTLIFKKANEMATKDMERLKAIVIPDELLSIFSGLRKKDEEKLFERLVLEPDVFMSLILKAGTLGYKYSVYTVVWNPTGANVNDIPRFAYKDETDNSIFSTDDTSLSEGQVKSLIDQTSTVVIKMLDKGDTWHCFFLTYKGLAGKEKDHPPHMHYLSSSWGLTREQVISNLKQKNYSLPSVHVWYNKV